MGRRDVLILVGVLALLFALWSVFVFVVISHNCTTPTTLAHGTTSLYHSYASSSCVEVW